MFAYLASIVVPCYCSNSPLFPNPNGQKNVSFDGPYPENKCPLLRKYNLPAVVSVVQWLSALSMVLNQLGFGPIYYLFGLTPNYISRDFTAADKFSISVISHIKVHVDWRAYYLLWCDIWLVFSKFWAFGVFFLDNRLLHKLAFRSMRHFSDYWVSGTISCPVNFTG